MRYTINENGCWIFTGSIGEDGYGKVVFKGQTYRAHRFIAHLTIKPLVASFEVVAHKCDTPACINPEHLFITTALGNAQDRDIKKRGACGEKHNLAVLKTEDVLRMRKLFLEGMSVAEISRIFKAVKYGAIASVIHRRTWRHLD